jgi:hypothetical protein
MRVPEVDAQDAKISIPRPLKELKGFTWVMLAPEQQKEVAVELRV